VIDWLALSVALPLLGAVATVALPRFAVPLGLAAALPTVWAALMVMVLVADQGVQVSALGGWGAPLGILLRADGLAAALLGMANLVALAVSLYAPGYFRGSVLEARFWPLWMLLWAALNGLFLAGDLFNLYVTLELLGLAAAGLGALTGQRAAVEANLRYLLVGLLGSMTYLLGVSLIYTALGTLDLEQAARELRAGPVAWVSFALMTGGLILKSALFPMHFWLPPAHANAPAPVSAALSALVVKAAFYLVLRLWLELFGPVVGASAALLLGLLGAAAVIWGAWRALRAERLKLLAAYSTVAQLGYLFLFFPLLAELPAGTARTELLGAAVLLALTHGFAKASLFLCAGLLQKAAGHDRIDELSAATQALPVVTLGVALAGVALIGLPPSGTFTAKWMLLTAAIDLGQWPWVPVIMAGTLLAAAYVFRVLGHAFASAPRHGDAPPIDPRGCPGANAIGLALQLPGLMLALVAVLALGMTAEPLWDLLASTTDPSEAAP
jgi:formate hydrogenlyase subunit 3/multisubunit Na+/H+ antiporter MnhD subunit